MQIDDRRPVWAMIGVLAALVVAVFVFDVPGRITDGPDTSTPVMEAGPGMSGMPGDDTSPETAAAMNEMLDEKGMPAEKPMDDGDPMPMVEDVETIAAGEFIDRAHVGSGRALIMTDGFDMFLRLEDFSTDMGPDLRVYLSKAPVDAPADRFDDDFVDLGDLKGNRGSMNYPIDHVDTDEYATVVIWSEHFAMAFTAAALQATA